MKSSSICSAVVIRSRQMESNLNKFWTKIYMFSRRESCHVWNICEDVFLWMNTILLFQLSLFWWPNNKSCVGYFYATALNERYILLKYMALVYCNKEHHLQCSETLTYLSILFTWTNLLMFALNKKALINLMNKIRKLLHNCAIHCILQ